MWPQNFMNICTNEYICTEILEYYNNLNVCNIPKKSTLNVQSYLWPLLLATIFEMNIFAKKYFNIQVYSNICHIDSTSPYLLLLSQKYFAFNRPDSSFHVGS